MGMFSEITTEGNVRDFVKEIRSELGKATEPETKAALKRLGIWALGQFEWDTPDWAADFRKEFE
jgi:hypothetical protein